VTTSGTQSTRLNVGPAPGVLSITVPSSASVGHGPPGATISGQIGTVTVSDGRGLSVASWTATVSITDFTGSAQGAPVVTNANASYWSGPATAGDPGPTHRPSTGAELRVATGFVRLIETLM
jgi:hypothetical protein